MPATAQVLRIPGMLAALLLCAVVAALAVPAPEGTRASGGDRFCPRSGDDPIRVARLVDKRVAVARRMAARHDCVVRVVKRDGRWLAVTDDLRYDRVNVIVRDERIKRIKGVY